MGKALRPLVAAIAAFVASCSGSKPTAKHADGGTGADFFARYQDAICQWAVRCGASPSFEDCQRYPSPFSHVALYEARETAAAIEHGRVFYDPGKAASCFAAIAARSCLYSEGDWFAATTARLGAACLAALDGMVAGGGACVIHSECATDRCRGTDECVCCAGTCATTSRVGAVGAACLDGYDCDDSAFCNHDTKQCQSLAAGGESCIGTGDCLPGLLCAARDGICINWAKDGEACSLDHAFCDHMNSYCEPTTKTCQPLLPLGAPCSDGGGTLIRYEIGCPTYADCVNGTCTPRRRPGEACTVDDAGLAGPPYCLDGECVAGTCQAVEEPACTLETAVGPDAGT